MAPEPQWEPRPFNREKFLLLFLAGVVAAQYLFLIYASTVCVQTLTDRQPRGLPPVPESRREPCNRIGDRLAQVFDLTTSTVLALLGGAGLGAMDRRGRS